jgi:hypothetical protein
VEEEIFWVGRGSERGPRIQAENSPGLASDHVPVLWSWKRVCVALPVSGSSSEHNTPKLSPVSLCLVRRMMCVLGREYIAHMEVSIGGVQLAISSDNLAYSYS